MIQTDDFAKGLESQLFLLARLNPMDGESAKLLAKTAYNYERAGEMREMVANLSGVYFGKDLSARLAFLELDALLSALQQIHNYTYLIQ